MPGIEVAAISDIDRLVPLAGKIGCFLPHRVDRGLPLETPKRVSIQIWQGRTST
jgi:hypothetical protein